MSDDPRDSGRDEPSADGAEERGPAERRDDDLTRTLAQLDDHPDHARWSGGSLKPGESFGHFEIQRLLGAGGMGEVYEAFDHDTGRHVAVKLLADALDSPAHRARFLREGQLAARVSHPNSLYIYGTEEIDSHPVIVMELAPGGTLKDRIKADGPLSPSAAVDAILEVIDGLEADAEEEVLHRDVKPANCFVATDGATKIGDFGLSISTLARARDETQLTATGSFIGTPAFASPEQLSGRELDMRADIYSVGATLFYLLTGKPPFVADQPVELISRVLAVPAPSVREYDRKIPRALARVVARSLHKAPAGRFADYSALRDALVPFGTKVPSAASIAIRLSAFGPDALVTILAMSMLAPRLLPAPAGPGEDPSGLLIWPALFAYLTLSEGMWGTTLSKRLTGLRVQGAVGVLDGLARAAARNAILLWPAVLGSIDALLAVTPLPGSFWFGLFVTWCVVLVITEARGGVMLHDRLTGTRVVWGPDRPARVDVTPPPESAPAAEADRGKLDAAGIPDRVGPYEILSLQAEDAGGATLLARDAQLQRRVWIRVHRLPTPWPAREAVRPGCLRWVNGRREESPGWDAYEHVEGATVVATARRRPGWDVVRVWLRDLVDELCAPERGAGCVSRARVWLGRRALLADFDLTADDQAVAASDGERAAQRVLADIIATLLNGGRSPDDAFAPALRAPVPLHARAFVEQLREGSFASLADLQAEVSRLLRKDPATTRMARFNQLGWPVNAVVFGALAIPWAVWIADAGLPADGSPWFAARVSLTLLACAFAALAVALRTARNPILGVAYRAGLGEPVRYRGAIVSSDGSELPAAAPRRVARALVAWAPGWAAGALLLFTRWGSLPETVWYLPPAMMLGGALHAVAHPERGIQDRIAGTYLVPR